MKGLGPGQPTFKTEATPTRSHGTSSFSTTGQGHGQGPGPVMHAVYRQFRAKLSDTDLPQQQP